ncbi:AGAP001888-PA [Anopheles gambiae str. PEST]|uniref:Alpha-(1,6)-fucosyltransferase n=1 Tax=Anopheles gambiae TaxID=7165 RepID=Q7PYD8_ANOGA|nr:alpha-(1,6)-fucosyltransferase [Anopheles coluzzii]XP_321174.5 alpha-(1,6)-fucosyltransferase [Anopheles gambiae]EAA01061.5 AGAP001888-PA [Anopheles gambiae str. PEST]
MIVRQLMGLNPWARVLVPFLFVWVLFVLIFYSKLNTSAASSSSSDGGDDSLKRLERAVQQLERSKQVDQELRLLVDEYLADAGTSADRKQHFIDELGSKLEQDATGSAGWFAVGRPRNGPSLEYERLRRRVETNTQELWNFLQSEVTKVQKQALRSAPELAKPLNAFLSLAADHKRSLLTDIERMRAADGYEAWRHREAADLSELVQKRLTRLQNPENCSTARKLLCRLNKGCGYGCQLHHVVYCFIMAYATERTLILKSKGWRYHKAGWEEVFQPISDTCLDSNGASHASWPGQSNTQVLTLPIIDSLNPRPPYLPLAIPADLAPRLMKLHGDPIVWWIGQFLKYLLKPTGETQQMLENGIERLGFKKPIVGVHVRRTDKVGTEAAFHGIEEYMTAVDDYYDQLELTEKVDKRRVFVASDDPKVIEETKTKYPHYEVIGDPNVAKMAAVSTRYTDSSLNGIILDIHLLSLSDYLVCTFSSQVCRVAYEIMQSMYPDASGRFRSLDDIYYYGGQNSHNREVVLPHEPKNHDEIQIRPGDLVGVAGNHWNGYSKGKNLRTNQVGLFPSFKVNDKIEIVELPKYPYVK